MAMSSNSSPILENLVKCAICLDNYDDPRCLPCSHTYCYKCIEKLCEDGIGQCPMRDNTIFFRHTINKFPINRIAKDLVECLNKSTLSQIKCDHCEQILAEFFCENCSKNYCTICLKQQHDIDQFKTHQINIFINHNSNHFCSEHIEEKLKYWCNNCQELVCSDCLLFKHKDHQFVPLDDIGEKIKNEFNLSMQQINQMKINLQKFNEKTNEVYQKHSKIHSQTKANIEQIINNLINLLEKRKKKLIKIINRNNLYQEKLIREEKMNIEEHIKTILIRELFIKQILNLKDYFQLIQMKKDFIYYNQLIYQQYQQLIQGFITHFQYFNINQEDLLHIQEQLQNLGRISSETFLTNHNQIQPLLYLADFEENIKYGELNGIYTYGYRFHLNKSLKINSIRVKVILFDNDLITYILNNDDILIQKEILQTNNQNSSNFKWITIPINCRIEQNYYIFISAQSTKDSIPLITYKESNQNLRQINEYISVRSKRAKINQSNQNIDIKTKFNVIYDALFQDDDQNETKIPAIEMILDI